MFEGLQGVSPGLSFSEDDKLSLRDECMAHLNRQLPRLDPDLMRYLVKFKIPELELFLLTAANSDSYNYRAARNCARIHKGGADARC